jgi:hypothetical protein
MVVVVAVVVVVVIVVVVVVVVVDPVGVQFSSSRSQVTPPVDRFEIVQYLISKVS